MKRYDSPLLECVLIIDKDVSKPLLASPEFGIHVVTEEVELIKNNGGK